MFRFSWNGPDGKIVCFCFPCGNETPGFPTFLSRFVSIPPPKVGAPLEIGLRISVDHSYVGAITEILIEIKGFVKTHWDPVQLFDICLFLMPADPTCDAPLTKEMETRKRDIQVNGRRNGAPSLCVSFLETRNAQGATFIVSWKRNLRKIRVCFLCFLFPVFRLRP